MIRCQLVTALSLLQELIFAPTALGIFITRHHDPPDNIGSHSSADCDDRAGVAFLEKYRIDGADGEELVSTTGLSSSSSFQCRARWSERTSEGAAAQDYICRGRNLQLVVNETAPVPVGLRVWPGASWTLPAGQNLKLDALYGHTVNVTLMNANPGRGQCDEVDNRTIVLYELVNTWNPYEGGHQLIMAYASVLALKLDPQRLRVLLTQPFPESKARWQYDLLSMVFSRGGPLTSPNNLAARTICASDIVIPIGGHNSMVMQNKGVDDPVAASCRGGAPLMLGMKRFVLQAMSVQPVAPTVSVGDRVLMLIRIPSDVHPQPFKRVWENYQEVADELSSRALNHVESGALAMAHSFLQNGTRRVTVISPETLSLVEQVRQFADADFAISAHSAALMWMYLMPQCSKIIEFCTGSDFHYVNEAHYAGLGHRCLSGLYGWGMASFEANVEQVVRAKRTAEEAWRTCIAAAAGESA
jgi:hypothetical protein